MINIDAEIANADWLKGLRALGGPGSGNFGHAGRPGQIGGSASATGGGSVFVESSGTSDLTPNLSAPPEFGKDDVPVTGDEYFEQVLETAPELSRELQDFKRELEADGVQVKVGNLDPMTITGQWEIAVTHTGLKSLIDARQRMRDAGVEPPRVTVQFEPMGNNTYAGINADVLTINSREPAWVSPELLAAQADEDFKDGYHPMSSPDSVLVHEMGHRLHQQAMNKEHAKEDFPVLDQRQNFYQHKNLAPQEKMARQVSRYAMQSNLEFVADTFAGLIGGQTYPKDVMDAYAKLNGPPVSKRPL